MNFTTVTRYICIIAGNTRINLFESRQIHLVGQQSEFVVTRFWRQINNGATEFVLVSLRETLIKFHILSCLYCWFSRNFTLFKCMPWANFTRCSRRCLFACHLCFKHVLVFLLNNWSLCSQKRAPLRLRWKALTWRNCKSNNFEVLKIFSPAVFTVSDKLQLLKSNA